MERNNDLKATTFQAKTSVSVLENNISQRTDFIALRLSLKMTFSNCDKSINNYLMVVVADIEISVLSCTLHVVKSKFHVLY